ncbi:MAG: hypothetical protein H6538_02210 [Bacteroidales bacterium]|nr:hypothetical protein [Bacteroidales bacterium]
MNFLLHLIFIATFVFLFVVSIIILKPFRIHRKRPVSTIAIKVSYLLYLLSFLLLAYLVLFYSGSRTEEEDELSKNPYLLYYVAVILAFFIPNLGIMLRRKFNKYRPQYNIIFTFINVFTTLVLSFIIYTMPWEF